MARPLRIELSGGLYHVTSRGDRREDIYFTEDDRREWMRLLGQVCGRFNWVCHAWCQMTNHYHLVVETPEANLSQGMRQLNGVYTQWINRTYDRVGHVFQGRYKAILVEKDSYLLELARYVVLNPVRAGMVRDASRWAWSSYAEMVGVRSAPEWLETDWLLAQFGKQRQRAIANYIEFVREGMKRDSVWAELKGQIYLGSDKFVERMQRVAVDQAETGEIPRQQRRAMAKPLAHYAKREPSRDAAIVAAYATGDYTMQEIAEHYGIHYATVSRIIRKSENV
ncbi:MAG: transposase [Pseudomonadota bacterium]